MERRDIDWRVLRGSALVLAATLAVTGGAIYGAGYFKAAMESAFERDQRRFLSASRQYLALDEEERIIREYLPRFRELEAAGLIGEERRLNWTESLRRVSAELKLPSLSYAIAPREPYEPPVDIQARGYEPFASRMGLNAGLVHGEDLFRLFQALERRAKGLFNVEACTLRRGSRSGSLGPDQANVNADCELLWFTLRKPSPEEIGL